MQIDLSLAVRQPAFLGGYTYESGMLEGLSPSDPELDGRAELTLTMWRAARAVGDDFDVMAASQDGKTSVCLSRAGLLIEGKDKLNLGLLRSMVREADAVSPETAEPPRPSSALSLTLLNLARWLERLEVRRRMEISAGDQNFFLSGRKGKFSVTDGGDLLSLTAAIRAATADGAPVKLRYSQPNDASGALRLQPADLFGEAGEDVDWSFGANGSPERLPVSAEVDQIAAMIALAEAFDTWRDGKPAELLVLRKTGSTALRAETLQGNSLRIKYS